MAEQQADLPPSEINIVVATNKGSDGTDAVICHEPDPDDPASPRCNTHGSYRNVTADVYPVRRTCNEDRCWQDGEPDELANYQEWLDRREE